MNKIIAAITLFFVATVSIFAQEGGVNQQLTPQSASVNVYKQNTVFAEVGQSGSLYSLNFDRIFWGNDRFKVAARVGLGISNNVASGDIDPAVSLEMDGLLGKNNHYFEFGVGVLNGIGFEQTAASVMNETENGTKVVKYTPEKEYNTLNLLGRVGYRYQPAKGGIFVRASVTPLTTVYSKTGNLGTTLAGAIGVGYTFKQKTVSVPAVSFE